MFPHEMGRVLEEESMRLLASLICYKKVSWMDAILFSILKMQLLSTLHSQFTLGATHMLN